MKSLHHKRPERETGEHKHCLVCNKEFYVCGAVLKRNNRGKYCSRECMWKSPPRTLNISGSNHYNWKGGVTKKDHILRDKFGKTNRKRVFIRDKFTCQICGKVGGLLHVDHIKSWSMNIEKRFDLDNCRTLCMACHYESTFHKPMPITVKNWGIKSNA
jgi:5-methylcytosine-specific restriction endonuclease McrA